MNVILGWLGTLLTGLPIREASSALAIVQRNAQMQAKLIDDLLDMNRLMSGKLQLNIGPVDIVSALQAAIQGLQPTADARGVVLHLSAEPPAITTQADRNRLQQVLWNLLAGRVARPAR